MNSNKIRCPSCGEANTCLVKNCQTCGSALGRARGAPPPKTSSQTRATAPSHAQPRVPISGSGRVSSHLRFRLDGSPLEALRSMCGPLSEAQTRCPQCHESAIARPPFNLDEFRCPSCSAEMYPFVWIGDALVDLRAMRETLAAVHADASVARAALLALRTEQDRGSPIEALLHVPTIAAHAIVACTRAVAPQLEWWTFAGVLHPGLFGGLWVLQLLKEVHRRQQHVETHLSGYLAAASFDPLAFPNFEVNQHTSRVLAQLDLHRSWPVCLQGGAEAYATLGAHEASTWSLVLDRRERTNGHAGNADIDSQSFVDEVASEVIDSERDRDIIRTERRLSLVRLNDVPLESGLRKRALAGNGSVYDESPALRRICTRNHVIETVNLSTGGVLWSCVRSQDQGPLLGVRWATFYRRPWGRGVEVNGRYVDPARALAAAAERKAILEVESPWVAHLSDFVPVWASRSIAVAWLIFTGWVVLSVAVGAEPFSMSSEPLNVARILFCGLLLTACWRRYKARRNPFPTEFWQPKELALQLRTARRVQDARVAIAKLWRRFDYSAPTPASVQLSVLRTHDRLDHEAMQFAVHCQDRLIQDAFIDTAERHGIDMSKFKEGLQQITNYGVIAAHIEGPVAAGANATAQSSEKSKDGSRQSILKKKHQTQAGAA